MKNPFFPFYPKSLDIFGNRAPKFSLSDEVLAGITVGLIALPMALALGIASIPSGISTPISAPALGIFTAIVGGLIISLLGGSRVQIGGPTAAFVPLILLIVAQHGYVGLVMATMMAGVIQIFMGATRLGTLIKYIPISSVTAAVSRCLASFLKKSHGSGVSSLP